MPSHSTRAAQTVPPVSTQAKRLRFGHQESALGALSAPRAASSAGRLVRKARPAAAKPEEADRAAADLSREPSRQN